MYTRYGKPLGDDPWASTSSGSEATPAAPVNDAGGAVTSFFSSIGQSASNLFGSAAAAGTTVAQPGVASKEPSTVSQVGSGLAAFLTALAPRPPVPIAQAMPYRPPGMSMGTKLALAGGAALVVILIARR